MLYPDLNDNEFDLTMYVPTRGRPHNAYNLETQFYKTISLNSRIKFILSSDDPELDNYLNLPWVEDPIIITPLKRGFVDPLNMGYLVDRKQIYSYAVGFMGDDHMPRTVGWDQAFVQALLELGSGFVYGNDGIQGEAIPTQIAMTSNIPLTLGYMTLPELSHLYADNYWLDLGKAINRIKYLPDVYLEHMHPAAGKVNSDAGYEFSGSFALDQSDRAIYKEWLDLDLENEAKRLASMMRRMQL